MRVVSNTGAYGNHGGETLFAACGEAVAVYRCPNKKVDGYTAYTKSRLSSATWFASRKPRMGPTHERSETVPR